MSGARRSHVSLVQPTNPERPAQALMLAVCNSYMLWALFWIQFLTNMTFFNYNRFNLSYYTSRPDPFGMSLPELFLLLSAFLALFAIVAVTFGTRETPKLWRRVAMVTIFSTITVGFSGVCLGVRTRSYNASLLRREGIMEHYQEISEIYVSEFGIPENVYRLQKELERSNREIDLYHEMYGEE